MDEEFLVILFQSTHHATRGEQVAKRADFDVRCIPTPRHISSDCGIVLRIRPDDREGILARFDEEKVEFVRIESLRP